MSEQTGEELTLKKMEEATGNKPSAETAFKDRLTEMARGAFVSGAVGLAKELGLFETMASYSEPKTLPAIAEAVGIKPRYLKGIFVVLVPSGIVQANADATEFYLPESHRGPLVATGLDPVNYTWAACRVFQSYTDVLECCKVNGPPGVPLQKANKMDYWLSKMSLEQAPVFADELGKSSPELVDKLDAGINAIELGCGAGHHTKSLAERFPKSNFTATDLDITFDWAKDEMTNSVASNLNYKTADVYNLPVEWTNKWDWVYMIDVFHDLPYARKAVEEMKKLLKPGGLLSIIDVGVSSDFAEQVKNPAYVQMYSMSLFRCLPCSLVFEGSDGEGVCLGNDRIVSMMQQGGFENIGIGKMFDMPLHIFGYKPSSYGRL